MGMAKRAFHRLTGRRYEERHYRDASGALHDHAPGEGFFNGDMLATDAAAALAALGLVGVTAMAAHGITKTTRDEAARQARITQMDNDFIAMTTDALARNSLQVDVLGSDLKTTALNGLSPQEQMKRILSASGNGHVVLSYRDTGLGYHCSRTIKKETLKKMYDTGTLPPMSEARAQRFAEVLAERCNWHKKHIGTIQRTMLDAVKAAPANPLSVVATEGAVVAPNNAPTLKR